MATTHTADIDRLSEITNRLQWLNHLLDRLKESECEHSEWVTAGGDPAPRAVVVGHHNAEINRLNAERAAIFHHRAKRAA
jgi:hypothetical protein